MEAREKLLYFFLDLQSWDFLIQAFGRKPSNSILPKTITSILNTKNAWMRQADRFLPFTKLAALKVVPQQQT